MFLFLRLLLAHFLGDFPLQFNIIFKMKLSGFRGIIPHALILFACYILLSWPFLNQPLVLAFILFLAVCHLIQDSFKLNLDPKYSFWSYTGDQLLHAATIALIFLIPVQHPRLAAGYEPNLLEKLYANNVLVMYLIAIIAVTYNGYFMIRCFKDTFLRKSGRYNAFEKWFGMAERALILSFFLSRGSMTILLPLSLLIRPVVFAALAKRLRLHREFISLPDMVLSWVIALSAGSVLFLFQTGYTVY